MYIHGTNLVCDVISENTPGRFKSRQIASAPELVDFIDSILAVGPTADKSSLDIIRACPLK